jgi:hypothetical protein
LRFLRQALDHPRYDLLEGVEMSITDRLADVVIGPGDYDLLYDALRFARDEFIDVNRLSWSETEYARLQDLIDAIEPLIEANRAST